MDIKDKPYFNYIPRIEDQSRVDGRYLQNSSVRLGSLSDFPQVDKKFIAGEDIAVTKAVGLWGYITQTDSPVTAAQATMVQAAAPTTNYDGTNPMTVLNNGGDVRQVLLSWSGLSADPSGTGITILTREIRFTLEITQGGGAAMDWYENNASFDETAVTWNTKPATTIGGDPQVIASGGGNPYVSPWLAVTSDELANIRANGVTLVTGASASGYDIDDEDQSSPPKLEVRYTYEAQDGKGYLASGLATKYADAFRGIAQNTVLKGQEVIVRVEGVSDNFTGLTSYSDYQLSDTPGEIQTGTSATSDKVIGNAKSDTQLQVKYILNDAT